MTLAGFLHPELTVIALQATTVGDAGEVLLEHLARSGRIRDLEKLRQRVAEDRPEDIVALGDRAFLLHYRTDAADELVVALGTAREPICRGRDEGEDQCARIILLVVAPPRQAARYLQVVGTFARLLSRQEVIDAMLAQRNAEDLVSLTAFAEAAVPEQLLVRDIMSPRPVSVHPETPLRDAALLLVRRGLTALPVLAEDGQLLGLLSDRELMRQLLTSHLQTSASGRTTDQNAPGQVRDVMTRQVLCVSPDQPLSDVASLMVNKNVDRVPVVHEGQLVGFLTRGDIVRKLLGT